MTWSLNEIDALSRKAARGGGMDWGLAEETGRAVRWLCAAGWPGPEALARLLRAQDGLAWDTLRPRTDTTPWTARGGLLCPSAAGAALTDRAQDLAAGRPIAMGATSRPLLLIPYTAWAADLAGRALSIRWPGLCVTCGPGQILADIPGPAALTAARADTVEIAPADGRSGQPRHGHARAEISADTIHTLTEFARRTYAPATPESRATGAGAGLTDND